MLKASLKYLQFFLTLPKADLLTIILHLLDLTNRMIQIFLPLVLTGEMCQLFLLLYLSMADILQYVQRLCFVSVKFVLKGAAG